MFHEPWERTARALVYAAMGAARMVREPRVLLAEMGCTVDDDVEIAVWDSSAEQRYLVLPQRPAGTEDLTEDELADLVTRDAMIGVARL